MKLYVLLLPEGIEPPEDGDFVTLWHGNGWGEDVEIREAMTVEIADRVIEEVAGDYDFWRELYERAGNAG